MAKPVIVGVLLTGLAASGLVAVLLLRGEGGTSGVVRDGADVRGCLPELASPLRSGFPPPAVLAVGDACQTGGIGTNCWEWGCGDVAGIVVPATPISVSEGQPLRIALDFDAFDTHVRIWRANSDRLREGESGDTLVSPADVDQVWEGAPPPGRTIELRPDLSPGRYAIEVFAYKVPPGGLQTPGPFGGVGAGGDVSYGFHIVVE